ncbi:ERF family protein [Mediterraneibacter glycyrrhizinilyticus]|nr:ERF family protein [Mediterraneibacter glycyrrhizinilyticus]MBM6801853.1 ERF family protein [Mediterraneibacter glycyrrhizinilyticus]
MKKRHMLNLQQKLLKISKKLPELIKKHYSDEVDYDFVKIDDIYEIINPAFAKYHICIQEMEEKDSKTEFKDGRWVYTSELYFCLVNADKPEEREPVHIHLIGDHEDSPAKAQGAAWTYGLKHFLLYKFQIKQVSEDPDMKGRPSGGACKEAKMPDPPKAGRTSGQKDTEPKKTPSDIVGKSPLYGRLAGDKGENKDPAGSSAGNGGSCAKQVISAAPDPAEIFGRMPDDATKRDDEETGTGQKVSAYPASGGKEAERHPDGDGGPDGGNGNAPHNSPGKEAASHASPGKGRVIPMPVAENAAKGSQQSTDGVSRPQGMVPEEASGSSDTPEQEETLKEQDKPQEAVSASDRTPAQQGKEADAGNPVEREEPVLEEEPLEQDEAVSGENSGAALGEEDASVNEGQVGPDDRNGNGPVKEDGETAKPDEEKDGGKPQEQDAPERDKVPAKEGKKREKGRHRRKKGSGGTSQMSLLDFPGSFGAEEENTDSGPAERETLEGKEENAEGCASGHAESSGKDAGSRTDEPADGGSLKEEDGFIEAEEVPFDEADEEDFFKALEEEIRDEDEKPLTLEEALQTICPYALFAGKTFAEMLESDAGRKQLSWFATEYMGSDFRVRDAAKMVLENLEQKAA